jgi:hypothetical protein
VATSSVVPPRFNGIPISPALHYVVIQLAVISVSMAGQLRCSSVREPNSSATELSKTVTPALDAALVRLSCISLPPTTLLANDVDPERLLEMFFESFGHKTDFKLTSIALSNLGFASIGCLSLFLRYQNINS